MGRNGAAVSRAALRCADAWYGRPRSAWRAAKPTPERDHCQDTKASITRYLAWDIRRARRAAAFDLFAETATPAAGRRAVLSGLRRRGDDRYAHRLRRE